MAVKDQQDPRGLPHCHVINSVTLDSLGL